MITTGRKDGMSLRRHYPGSRNESRNLGEKSCEAKSCPLNKLCVFGILSQILKCAPLKTHGAMGVTLNVLSFKYSTVQFLKWLMDDGLSIKFCRIKTLLSIKFCRIRTLLKRKMEKALVHAAAYGDTRQVAQMLLGGARVDSREQGFTPLLAAAEKGKTEVCELLLPLANIEESGPIGNTALN